MVDKLQKPPTGPTAAAAFSAAACSAAQSHVPSTQWNVVPNQQIVGGLAPAAAHALGA